MGNKTKKNVVIAVMISISLILTYLEYFIMPLNFLNIKIGFSNIIIVLALKIYEPKISIFILIVKLILGSLILRGPMAFLYSAGGGILSYIVMYIFIKIDFKEVSLIGISVLGSVFHYLGQIITASIIYKNILLMSIAPYFLMISLIAGIITGIIANLVVNNKNIRRLYENSN